MDSNQTLWKEILSEIETKVSRANFLTLFKNTSLENLSETSATIAAASTMTISLLDKRFKNIIEEAIFSKTKKKTSIVFVSKTIPKNGKKEETPLFIEERPAPVLGHLPRVRADFIFSTLAVSDSNRLAFESARTVAKN